MGRVMVRCLLAAGVMAVCASALARVPAQFEVVEQFAARLSAGNVMDVHLLLPTEAYLAEHDLFLRVSPGHTTLERVRELVAQGARLELSFESASFDGAVIVTRERMWLDGMTSALTPLRSTGVYLVEGERLLGVTRVLDADQRDVLMREAIVGDWTALRNILSHRADGTYEMVEVARQHEVGELYDAGVYTVEGSVVQFVSDGQGAAGYGRGDTWSWRLTFTSLDQLIFDRPGSTGTGTRVTE